jgi:hypothetical protein
MEQRSNATTLVIRIRGDLGESGARRFPGLEIETGADGDSLLRGPVCDQAALYGLLRAIRDAGLELMEIRRENSTGDSI